MQPLHEAAFAAALCQPQLAVPAHLGAAGQADFAERFAVHRNTLQVVRVDALRQTFPVLQRLLGERYFAALAAAFVEQRPPASAVLHEYGEGLAAFVEQFPPLAAWPYLADVARLEWARLRALHAADTPPLRLAKADEEGVQSLLCSQPRWHPSVTLLRSAYPLWRLWHSQLEQSEPLQGAWQAQDVLIWRQDLALRCEALDSGSLDLLLKLQGSASLAEGLAGFPGEGAPEERMARFATLLHWQVFSG